MAALGSLAVFRRRAPAFAAACESLNQDRRNAERYDNTAQALQGSGERLDIRLGIAAGSTSVLGEYVAAVQDQLNRLARCRRHPWTIWPQLSYQHVVKLSRRPRRLLASITDQDPPRLAFLLTTSTHPSACRKPMSQGAGVD